ncbi:M3 family metallopeptidase [uncultured Planktomarina sp.]|uniref:M3 family metallopeptidase n=1 Tax=uncultured Planktomarina sp. TaxID=1538529 RepID=UPI003260E02B
MDCLDMNLLEPWHTPFGLAPFDAISDADFAPAMDAALAQARSGMQAIAQSSQVPSFENTIEAQEVAEAPLNQLAAAFYTLASTDSTPIREELQRNLAPKLSAYTSAVTSDVALFARIEDLWSRRASMGLSAEQERVLMLTRRDFIRAGAKLTGAEAARMAEIKSRLASLGTQFMQNLLADERDWALPLKADDLAGLPDFVVQAAQAAGQEKGLDGPVVTLSRSLIVPFLEFADRRDLREMAYKAWAARGATGGATDNREIVSETLRLRQEQAALLGYESFSDFKLETQMAKTPARVRDLLMQVWGPAKARAAADGAILAQMMTKDGLNGPLQAWDWRYYAQRRRKADHDLDESELKPYLQLDQMIAAAFDCAQRLFGLTFQELSLPLHHKDARVWEVRRDGAHIALFVGDYFARSGKRSGAWCSALQSQRKRPSPRAPIVLNVCNFAKPSNGSPALLSFDDARTLFHEFGHALHQMLSDVSYSAVSGTSVARDFVELPSQLFEHWLEVPEVLQKFAIHAQTGAVMPDDLLKRMLGAATFDMGFQTVEYIASALVDLSFHEAAAPQDPMLRQAEILADIGMPTAIGMRHATPQFAHVFAGDGYSSGYYSYMWSEVMDADAFASFEEAGGPFDRERARALQDNILARGGSVDAEELYVAFRGKLPDATALLHNRGL